jgi:methanogenic corrinoid protein MtbC1
VDELDALADAIVELEERETLRLARDILAKGEKTPAAILNTCQQAMRVVGERYERQEYYLSGLILAGEIFKEVLDLVQPDEERPLVGEPAGVILLGTVAGDIHDVGKNMFSTALRSFRFSVVDLGVDVSAKRFLQEVRRSRPDVVCLSGLITGAFHSMRATVGLLRAHESELGYMPPIVLGGSTMDEQVCRYAGADFWSTDAMEGVRICLRLFGGPSGTSE